MKNHPCSPNSNIDITDSAQNDSFDNLMSQAASEDFKDKLENDSFADMISQADDTEFNIESPKSKKSNVEKWLVTSEQSKNESQNFSLKKRKLENTNPNIQNKQFRNNPFSTENYVNTNDPFQTENYVNSNGLMILQAQQAFKRQEFFHDFFSKEQELEKQRLDLIKNGNKS